MLSIGKLTPARAGYYVDQLPAGGDEYYLRSEHSSAQWVGSACARLGLVEAVTPDAFRSLLDGLDPRGGQPLGLPQTTDRRVAGFDLCFSAPKSVSVAWALAPPELAEVIAAAHDRAVRAAVETLEREVIRARRGAGGCRLERTGGVAAAAFDHRTSRAGDPQVHTHVVIANATPDAAGRWTAIYGTPVYRWAKTLGYVYQAELRAGLTRDAGFGWTPVHNGTAEIDGVPEGLRREFSTRRAQIEAALADAGGTSAAAAQAATLATRKAKADLGDLDALRAGWHQRAQALGIDPDLVTSLTGPDRLAFVDFDVAIPELLGPGGLTANSSTFDRRQVIRALAEQAVRGATAGELSSAADRVMTAEEVVKVAGTDPVSARYSTTELIDLERRVIERSCATVTLGPGRRPVADSDLDTVFADRPTLSAEQQAMIAAITTNDSAVTVVIGRAGTGKTFALDAAREAWQRAGRPVVGAALAARAATELQAGSGIASTTVDRLLADLDRPGPLRSLPPGAVVVIDEAGMIGTRKLARLLDHTRAANSTLVLVGDPRQLPEIEAGGSFAALARHVPTVELTHNRRQHHEWERHALDQLRGGCVPDAVTAYAERGRITLARTAEAVREKMIDDWWAARQAGESVGLYALRRTDVDDLNRRARCRLRNAGRLGADLVDHDGRSFAAGDEVMCLRNDRRLGVRNGTVVTVRSFEPDTGSLSCSDGIRLPSDYLAAGHVTHAYAATIHKAQGATVDRGFLLGSDNLFREAGYVGLSRARTRSDLYLVSANPAGDPSTGRGFEVNGPVERLARDLLRTAAQQTALEQTPPGRAAPATSARDRSAQRAATTADPPAWLVEAIGPPPVRDMERRRWADRAERLTAYREAHSVTGPEPLGPRPADPGQRRAWDLAQLCIEEHRRSLDLDQGLDR